MSIEAFAIAVHSPQPLRKKYPQQDKVYTRPPNIQEKLQDLLCRPREEILSLSQIADRESSSYIPSECLIHLLRGGKGEPSSRYFEVLYKCILRRIMLRLRSVAGNSDSSESLTGCLIRERVLDRFNGLLASEQSAYEDRLDFWEVRFDMTLKCLIQDARKQVLIETNRSRPLEHPETGEISAEVEEAAALFDPFAEADSDENDYRFRLEAAIDSLPPEQKRIVSMLKMGIPIDSKDPAVLTIAKTLKRSEKTIRTKRDQAFASIKAFFERGVTP